nr:hypothetical protein [Cupriavidus taiwanensis]
MENRVQNILRRSRSLISDLRRLKFLYPKAFDKIISIKKGLAEPYISRAGTGMVRLDDGRVLIRA